MRETRVFCHRCGNKLTIIKIDDMGAMFDIHVEPCKECLETAVMDERAEAQEDAEYVESMREFEVKED